MSLGRKARSGHQDVPAVPRRFYVQLKASYLTALSFPTRIASALAKQLKITPHVPMSVAFKWSGSMVACTS
jgi:hypothetical protein